MTIIDAEYQVETPEGIDLVAEPAGPITRAMAFGIDFIIRAVVFLGLLGAFGSFEWSQGLISISIFLVEWFYPVLFEIYFGGQTPGKKIVGIYVVQDDLTPITWGPSLTRNLLRVADFLPFFYVGGLLFSLNNKAFKRLGDMAAGTLVVYKHKDAVKLQLPNVEPLAPAIPFELEDQIAIIDFTERSSELSDGRKKELANILKPIHGQSDQQAVEYVQSIGRWYLGGKD